MPGEQDWVMKHKNSHLLVGYWNRLRKGRSAPDQTDIDPRAIKRMLSSVFILDAESPSHPIYRLAGTALCERFGFELRGTGFLAHWDTQSSIALVSLIRQGLKLRHPVCISSIGTSPGSGMVELETILAPISCNGGEVNRFLGMIQILSDHTILDGQPIAFQRIAGSQFIRENDPLSPFDDPPPPSGGLRDFSSHPRAPHLRLVVSQHKPHTVHFADEQARELLSALDSGSVRPKSA
jgi:hypothetical protein